MGIFKKKNTTPDIEITSLNNAAEEGDAVAMLNLGIRAHEAGDLKGAKSWYERAADAGNSKAMVVLAVMARDAGDLKGAKSWLERAPELDEEFLRRVKEENKRRVKEENSKRC